MMVWIRAAAKAIREEHDRNPTDIAYRRRVRDSTVVRFESGQTRNVDVDRMIAAYAEETGVPAIEFWRRALELMERANTR